MVATVGLDEHAANFPQFSNAYVLGAALTWDPFDGGLTHGKVVQAKANLSASQSSLDAASLSVISDVSQAYINLRTAEQHVVTANSEVANAQVALDLALGRYQAGLGIFLNVLDAQAAQVTAQTNLVTAQSSVNQARAALAHAIGDRQTLLPI